MKRLAFLIVAALVSTGAAHAQKWTGYAPVAVSIPKGSNDPSLTVFRAKVFELAQKRDKDALANLIARDFFWERDFGGGYDKKSNPAANFAQALSLDAKNNAGWRLLMSFVEQGTAPHATRRGVFCGPAEPKYDAKAFEKLLKATDSDVFEWSYPGYDAVIVRAKAAKDSAEIAKLGPAFCLYRSLRPHAELRSGENLDPGDYAGRQARLCRAGRTLHPARSAALLRQTWRSVDDHGIYRRRRLSLYSPPRLPI